MEKLSSILPTSPRVRSVDMDEAPPARPGAPSYGKKAGRNTVTERAATAQKTKLAVAPSTTRVLDPKEVARGKIVDDLARNFFETRLQKPVAVPSASEQVIDNLEPDEVGMDPVYEQAIKAYEKPVLSEKVSLVSAEA